MSRTLKAILEPDGTVKLLEPVDSTRPRRVLVTIPDEEASPDESSSRSRWARAAEFFASNEAGRLDGASDAALGHFRDFRDGFRLDR